MKTHEILQTANHYDSLVYQAKIYMRKICHMANKAALDNPTPNFGVGKVNLIKQYRWSHYPEVGLKEAKDFVEQQYTQVAMFDSADRDLMYKWESNVVRIEDPLYVLDIPENIGLLNKVSRMAVRAKKIRQAIIEYNGEVPNEVKGHVIAISKWHDIALQAYNERKLSI